MCFSRILCILEMKVSYRRRFAIHWQSYLSFHLFGNNHTMLLCHPLQLCPSSKSARKQPGLLRGYPPGRTFIPGCVILWLLLHMKFNGTHTTDASNNRQKLRISPSVTIRRKKFGHNLDSTPARWWFFEFLKPISTFTEACTSGFSVIYCPNVEISCGPWS